MSTKRVTVCDRVALVGVQRCDQLFRQARHVAGRAMHVHEFSGRQQLYEHRADEWRDLLLRRQRGDAPRAAGKLGFWRRRFSEHARQSDLYERHVHRQRPGADFGGLYNADSFGFAYVNLTGDGTITARFARRWRSIPARVRLRRRRRLGGFCLSHRHRREWNRHRHDERRQQHAAAMVEVESHWKYFHRLRFRRRHELDGAERAQHDDEQHADGWLRRLLAQQRLARHRHV